MIGKRKIIHETEKFVRENIPKTRITKEGSIKSYLTHVFGARKYALELAEIYDADKFVVEIAILLHDVGGDAGENHHKESAKMTKDFLSKFDVPRETLNRIIKCIENHPMGIKVSSLEEQIIQDADGIIFLEDTYKIFLESVKGRQTIEQIRFKLEGMYNKIKTKEGIKIADRFFPKVIEEIEKLK